jgi:hypothetical protein
MLLRLLRDLFTRGPRGLVEPRHLGNEGPSPSTAPDVREILALGSNAQDAGRWPSRSPLPTLLAVRRRRRGQPRPGASLLRHQGRRLEALPFAFLSVRRRLTTRAAGFARRRWSVSPSATRRTRIARRSSLCDDPRISTLWLYPAISGLLKAHPGLPCSWAPGNHGRRGPSSPQLSLWMRDRLLLTDPAPAIMADPYARIGADRPSPFDASAHRRGQPLVRRVRHSPRVRVRART